MFEVWRTLGRDETLRRLDAILTKLGQGKMPKQQAQCCRNM